jgi:hypothetical protein
MQTIEMTKLKLDKVERELLRAAQRRYGKASSRYGRWVGWIALPCLIGVVFFENAFAKQIFELAGIFCIVHWYISVSMGLIAKLASYDQESE